MAFDLRNGFFWPAGEVGSPLNILGRAKRMLQGFGPAEAPKTQYYHVACPAGHKLYGQRTEGYQALRCPNCGEGVFVLPRSPLPDPPAPPQKKRPQRISYEDYDEGPIALSDPPAQMDLPPEEDLSGTGTGARGAGGAEIEWVDDEPATARGGSLPYPDVPIEFDEFEQPAGPTANAGGSPGAPGAGSAHGSYDETIDERRDMMPGNAPGGSGVRPQNRPSKSNAADAPTEQPARPRERARRSPGQPVNRAGGAPDTAPGRPRRAHRNRHAESGADVEVELEPERPQVSLSEWAARHRHGLIFAGVGLLVVITVAFQLRRHQRERMPELVKIGVLEGLPALDAGEFDTAHRKLLQAARAAKALGGAVEDADKVIQGAQEAAIFVDLAPSSLEQIVGEAARADSENAWKEQFQSLYQGRSIILDGNASEYRILSRIGLNTRIGRIDVTGFRLLDQKHAQKGENSFIFGARLASVRLENGEWLVGLEPDSGVVMTHWDALKAAGWSIPGAEASAEDAEP